MSRLDSKRPSRSRRTSLLQGEEANLANATMDEAAALVTPPLVLPPPCFPRSGDRKPQDRQRDEQLASLFSMSEEDLAELVVKGAAAWDAGNRQH